MSKWQYEDGSLNLRFKGPDGRDIHAFIQPRPSYCDRGHWCFNVDGIPYIDGADSFPRYYMSLDNAIMEAETWLRWRLYKKPLGHGHPAARDGTDCLFDFEEYNANAAAADRG